MEHRSLVSVAGVVDLLVAQRPRPAGVAGAAEASVARWVAVTLDAGAPLAGLAAWLHPLAQPLSAGALLRGGTCRPWCSQPSPQVLQLSVDVQVAQAAVEAGAVPTSGAVLQGGEAARGRGALWHTWSERAEGQG